MPQGAKPSQLRKAVQRVLAEPGFRQGAKRIAEAMAGEKGALAAALELEALASATSEPARAFGFHDRGRIAEGLRADLLLVNGDPTVDITATRDIVGIWKLGVSHPRRSTDGPIEKR